MSRVRMLAAFLSVLGAGCGVGTGPVPTRWCTEIAGMPGVWRVAPRAKEPHAVWSELAHARDPSAPEWHHTPRCTGDEAIVFSWALRGGAVLHAAVAGHGLTDAKVTMRLIGRDESQFWPLLTWQPVEQEDSAKFAAPVPRSGEWVGGIVTVDSPHPAVARVEVASLTIEESRMPPRAPHLVLVTLDTFRADYVSSLNEAAPPTPTLDSLANAGVLFESAVSTSQCTGPSHASMLTGLYPFAHRVYRNEDGLSPDAVTLAEVLSRKGYRTLAAVSTGHLNPATSNLGQGFDLFLESRWPQPGGEPADVRTAEILRTLQLQPPSDSPWFMWLHYFDPHTPYTPPEASCLGCPRPGMPDVRYVRGMGGVAYDSLTGLVRDPAGEVERYCGEVRFLDRELGRLLAGLRALGILDHAVVVVVADHGESLGEHGIYFEHAGMFQEVLHVPLIISGTGIPSGTRISIRVSGVDVFPTLLARAGIGGLPKNYGRDLLRLASGRERAHHEVIFAESVRRAICAAWKDNAKFIWIPDDTPDDWSVPGRRMWVDLSQDPTESHNLIDLHADDARQLKTAFERAVARPLVALRHRRGDVDEDRLRALGYVPDE